MWALSLDVPTSWRIWQMRGQCIMLPRYWEVGLIQWWAYACKKFCRNVNQHFTKLIWEIITEEEEIFDEIFLINLIPYHCVIYHLFQLWFPIKFFKDVVLETNQNLKTQRHNKLQHHTVVFWGCKCFMVCLGGEGFWFSSLIDASKLIHFTRINNFCHFEKWCTSSDQPTFPICCNLSVIR